MARQKPRRNWEKAMYYHNPAMEEILRALLLASRGRQVAAYHVLLGQSPAPPSQSEGPLLLAIDAATNFLGVSRSSLYRLIYCGALTPVTLPSGGRRIRREDI
ncbi:MAG: hypothetical protein FJ280_25440, partial [Planctomycetes bacterium]|nr:hypothetical protein [Planctomycetota bacterium]